MLYRIFTEDVPENREAVLETVENVYDGFTVLNATGFWKGTKELSQVIEVVTEGPQDSIVKGLAESIRQVNKQEAVLVQRIENHNWFITGN